MILCSFAEEKFSIVNEQGVGRNVQDVAGTISG
jgi:hypothetical protein